MLSHYGSEPQKSAFERVLAEWNADPRRVRVVSIAVRYADLLTTAMVRQAAGQGADILHPYALWTGQLVRAGVLRPAPPAVSAEIRRAFSGSAVAAATVDGALYGCPTEVQTYALYCNMRLLRAAGVLRPPRTWAELEDTAYRCAARDRHGNSLVQGFGLSRVEDATVVGQTLALLASAGASARTSGLHASGGRTTVDSPALRAVLGLEKRLIDRGASSPGTSLYKEFPSGRVAMAINGGWWTGSLRRTMGDAYRDVTVVPVPGPTTAGTGTTTTSFLLGVNAACPRPEAAWEFLRWLSLRPAPAPGARSGARAAVRAPETPMTPMTPVTRMSALQVSVGSMTAHRRDMEVLLGAADDPRVRPFLDALHYASAEPGGPYAQRTKSVLRKNIEEVWAGRRGVESALRTAQRQIDREAARHT
ncbi:extracellular solute-binding protein [Streptomyces sp. NPDC004111]|uniref:extracellular solute-binding protein n=1 Tax=Streptomyces sp. NPDC004111 TaxID=3364690 RepID=UPI00367365B5